MLFYSVFRPHPAFDLRVGVGVAGIVRIDFDPDAGRLAAGGEWERQDDHPLIRETRRQLEAYFAGCLREFDLALDLRGTPFQRRVWEALLRIPYGETRSYTQLAAAIGSPGAARAVGSANHANPVAIVVPCHRVIAAGGGLGGYGGGLDRKQFLLDLERGCQPAV